MVHVINPSTQKAEEGGTLWFQGQLALHRPTKVHSETMLKKKTKQPYSLDVSLRTVVKNNATFAFA